MPVYIQKTNKENTKKKSYSDYLGFFFLKTDHFWENGENVSMTHTVLANLCNRKSKSNQILSRAHIPHSCKQTVAIALQ